PMCGRPLAFRANNRLSRALPSRGEAPNRCRSIRRKRAALPHIGRQSRIHFASEALMIIKFVSLSFRFAIALSLASVFVFAQTHHPPDPPAGFDKIEQMIPMRDGVKLHTIIYAPKSHKEQLPILLNRTPYGIDNIYRGFAPPSSLQELIDEGFIFAFQDIR